MIQNECVVDGKEWSLLADVLRMSVKRQASLPQGGFGLVAGSLLSSIIFAYIKLKADICFWQDGVRRLTNLPQKQL